MSEYGTQLREKQKARRAYGLMEGQFKGVYTRATTLKGVTGELLLQLLERRLDNVVLSRWAWLHRVLPHASWSRHGHFMVNGQKVDIPSYTVDVNDIVTVRAKSKEIEHFKIVRAGSPRIMPKWPAVNADAADATSSHCRHVRTLTSPCRRT